MRRLVNPDLDVLIKTKPGRTMRFVLALAIRSDIILLNYEGKGSKIDFVFNRDICAQ